MDKITPMERQAIERKLWEIFLSLGGNPTISTTSHTLEEE